LIDVLRLERHSNTVAQASLADTANEIAELSDFVQPVGSVAVKFGVIVTDTPEHEADPPLDCTAVEFPPPLEGAIQLLAEAIAIRR
jgi:hypothetical protein